MRRREKLFWLAVGAAFVIGFMALIPAHGEICKEGAKTGEEACTSYRLVPFLIIQIGKTLDALGVAITALATIAIAWFTLTLRRSTDRLWDAARESAAAQSGDMKASIAVANRSAEIAERSLTDLERPYLFILDYNWLLTERVSEEGFRCAWRYSVVNGGKLPAIIKNVKVGIRFGRSIPPMEDEVPIHDLLTAPLLAGGEAREILKGFRDESAGPTLDFEIKGGMAPIPKMAFNSDGVIAKIAIEYDGPMTTGHVTTACWEWHTEKYAFTQHGGAEHNQRT